MFFVFIVARRQAAAAVGGRGRFRAASALGAAAARAQIRLAPEFREVLVECRCEASRARALDQTRAGATGDARHL
eukprot:1788889-Pyramimonas_sp.AAC.1